MGKPVMIPKCEELTVIDGPMMDHTCNGCGSDIELVQIVGAAPGWRDNYFHGGCCMVCSMWHCVKDIRDMLLSEGLPEDFLSEENREKWRVAEQQRISSEGGEQP